jgi:hypothetical protein
VLGLIGFDWVCFAGGRLPTSVGAGEVGDRSVHLYLRARCAIWRTDAQRAQEERVGFRAKSQI